MRFLIWFRRLWDNVLPARRLVVADGDGLPDEMPRRDVVLVRDDDEDWSVGMRCPCGCGETIELMVIPEAEPKWALTADKKGRPTLHPSVWRKVGCRSHFWMRAGRVHWCD
jgi:hypothetical protein